MPEIVWTGATRTVILTRRWAIKIPGAWAHRPGLWWRTILLGMLGNMQEASFTMLRHPKLCPVWFALPGGFALVMRRARSVSIAEYLDMLKDGRADAFFAPDPGDGFMVPAERKFDSLGWLDGRLVAIDYGS